MAVGSGTGTPVIGGTPPTSTPVALPSSCISLARYAFRIGFDECAFFGVVQSPPGQVHSNRPLWTRPERTMVAHYLAEAQAEIEQVIHYPLCPTWFADESHDYTYPLTSKWAKVIEIGVEASTTIQAAAAVSYVTEPATVGPLATTVTEADEIKVYYPDSDYEIEPSLIEFGVGTITIHIPRCRLVDPDVWDDSETYQYDELTNFVGSVDVVRVYNDDTTQATLVWPHGTSTSCCPRCTGSTDTACTVLVDDEIGEMDILPATLSGSTWSTSSWSCYCHMPSRVRINYRAGLSTITPQAEDAVIRLAHAKMPHAPCNVSPDFWMWERDREIPRALTKQRLNCPFGLENGAWIAYRFAMSMRVVRGSTL